MGKIWTQLIIRLKSKIRDIPAGVKKKCTCKTVFTFIFEQVLDISIAACLAMHFLAGTPLWYALFPIGIYIFRYVCGVFQKISEETEKENNSVSK